MTMDSTKPAIKDSSDEHFLCDDWFDPLEAGVRTRIRGFIEELLEAELDAALGRNRYQRPGLAGKPGSEGPTSMAGHRHGHRERQILGRFGATTVRVPRARLKGHDGKAGEWKNATIPAYQRRTKRADALIAGAYLSGTNTRRVRRALAAAFGGAVGKDTVSRVWRKTKGEEFKRRIKTQIVLPDAETAAMLFWALLASGQITMRKVDGWKSLPEKPSDQIIDLAA